MNQILEKKYSSISESLIDSSPALYIVLDQNGTIIEVNKTFVDASGFSKKQLVHKKIDFLFTKSALSTWTRTVEKIMNQEANKITFNSLIQTKSGKTIGMTWHCKAFYNASNGENYLVCSGFEIGDQALVVNQEINNTSNFNKKATATKSKKVQVLKAQLKRKEEQLKEAEQISAIGYWEWDIKKDRIYLSEQAAALFGIKNTQAVTFTECMINLSHAESSKVKKAIEKAIKQKKEFEIEHSIVWEKNIVIEVRQKGRAHYDLKGFASKLSCTIQNITKYKMMQIQMEKSHQINESSLSGIVKIDLEGKVIYANPAAIKLWGFKSFEEVQKLRPIAIDYWHKDSQAKLIEMEQELLASGKIFSFNNLKGLKKDGTVFYPLVSTSLLKDEANKPIGYVCSFFDRSEKIQIETQLAKYEEIMKVISSNNKELIFAVQCNGYDFSKFKFIFMSGSISKILGYAEMGFTKYINHPEKFLHPDDTHIAVKMLMKMFETKRPVRDKYRLKHKKGKYIWGDVRYTPTLDENNEINFFYGHITDITKRVYSEEALKRSEKKYRNLFQNATVGIARMDITTKKVTDANIIISKQLGYSSKQHLISSFKASNHYIEEEEWEKNFKLLENLGFSENIEVRLRRLNGEIFWAQVSSKNISKNNEIEAVIIDITERKAFEDELKKSIHEKELLIKEIHHRVKNNLQIISGLLKLQITKITDPAVLEPLVQSKDRIETISLVHEKLYQTENISQLSFKSYLQDFTEKLIQVYESKNVTFNLQVPDIYLNAETSVPLALIFNELISNSMKHGFKEHSKNNLIKIDLKQKSTNELQIHYSDNGEGFDTSILQGSSKLGSKLINGLVNQLHGEIKIESKPKKGISVNINVLIRNG